MAEKRNLQRKTLMMLVLMLLLSMLACNLPTKEDMDLGDLPQNDSSDKENSDLVATYVGETELPPFQQKVLSFSVDENLTTLYVYEDGSVLGEQVLKYSYTQSGVDGDLVYATSEYNTVFEGVLKDNRGELSGILEYHFVSGGPGANDPQDQTSTSEVEYEIFLAGDIITGAPKGAEEQFTFELAKQ